MKVIFKVFDSKNEAGRWYEKFDVSDNLSIEYPYIEQAPPEDLINPHYIFGTGWVEDDEAVLDSLKKENADLKNRLDMAESAVLDLADMLLTK